MAMHKLYILNKPLYLAHNADEIMRRYHPDGLAMASVLNEKTVAELIERMKSAGVEAGILQHSQVDTALSMVKAHLKVLVAGGGLVETPNGSLLLIFRKGKWDLPKGKIDKGETIESCALREVKEETGLSALSLLEPITTTYHSYIEKGLHILKESHWFRMATPTEARLIPQVEEEITECVWVDPAKLQKYADNMHASVIDVLREARLLPEFGAGQ